MRQPEALSNFVKGSFHLKGEILTESERWFANRTLNEALEMALGPRPGPVHINISFDEPLTAFARGAGNGDCVFRKIDTLRPAGIISVEDAKRLAGEASGRRILIAGGFAPPSARMNKAFAKLCRLPDTVATADALANINAPGMLDKPDLLPASELLGHPDASPDLLITFGGSMLSKKMKEYLRRGNIREHWHVGDNEMLIDTFQCLSRRIEIPETGFFPRFANAMEHLARRKGESGMSVFKSLWHEAAFRMDENAMAYRENNPDEWTERRAVEKLMEELPARWNLQLSNGLTPRYAVTAGASRFHRRDCNRGVSGIDGSVSTALGASLAYKGTTVLVTGDMSMQYDMAALSSSLLGPRLKIIVINNGGGGIFRTIGSTRNLPELEKYFSCRLNLPVRSLAEGFSLDYFMADSMTTLEKVLPSFIKADRRTAVLELRVAQE